MSMMSVSSSGSLYDSLTKDSNEDARGGDGYKDQRRGIGYDDEEFEELVQNYLKSSQKSSSLQVIAQIVYAMISPILVALPLAVSVAGLPLFVVMLGSISTITAYSNCLIVAMATENNVRTFEELGDRAFGIKGYITICLLQVLYSITLMYISLSVWGDVISSIIVTDLPHIDFEISKHITTDSLVLYVGALLVAPFCFTRNKSMATLQWTSYAVIIAIITALLSVVIAFSSNVNEVQTATNPYKNILKPTNDWWIALFVITYCFAYNQKVFVIHSCLRINQWSTDGHNKSISQKWNNKVKHAHFIVGMLYLTFGIFGCLSILDAGTEFCTNYFLESNDFSSANRTFFNVLRVVVSLSLLLTLPGNCLAAVTTTKRMMNRCYIKYLIGCNDISRGRNSSSINCGADTSIHREYKLLKNDDVDKPSPVIGQSSVNRISSDSETPSVNRITDSYSDTARHSNSINGSEGGKSTTNSMINVTKGIIPGMIFWGLTLILALNLESTSMEIAFIGSIATCLLLFLLPSMLYFRLGLSSDFESIPIIGGLVPNYLYMLMLQILGIIFLVGEIALLIYIMLPGTSNMLTD